MTPTRTIKIWLEGADSALQQRFQLIDWGVFAAHATTDAQIHIDSYTNSILDHINKCMDKEAIKKQILFPQKETLDEQRGSPSAQSQ